MLVKEKLTYSDYAAMPDDGKRYQLIYGGLVMSPAPSYGHQNLSMKLFVLLNTFVAAKGLGEVLYAPLDVKVDEETVIQPDIIYIANESKRIIQERGLFGAPDLVVEIISPSSVVQDRYTKRDIYERFGVKEYWIVDPANESIEVLTLENSSYTLFSSAAEGTEARSKLLYGLTMRMSELKQQG